MGPLYILMELLSFFVKNNWEAHCVGLFTYDSSHTAMNNRLIETGDGDAKTLNTWLKLIIMRIFGENHFDNKITLWFRSDYTNLFLHYHDGKAYLGTDIIFFKDMSIIAREIVFNPNYEFPTLRTEELYKLFPKYLITRYTPTDTIVVRAHSLAEAQEVANKKCNDSIAYTIKLIED